MFEIRQSKDSANLYKHTQIHSAVYNRWTGLLDYWTHPKFHERSFSALFTAELPDSRRDIELPKKPKCFRGYIFHVGAHQELPSKRLAT